MDAADRKQVNKCGVCGKMLIWKCQKDINTPGEVIICYKK